MGILPFDIKFYIVNHGIWVIRIMIAAFCGCLIGYERSSRNKGAGVRTHAILALGSALIMLVSKYGFIDINEIDGSRIAAQIVSGVGFLGAGVIFVKNGNVSGLTTAAGMWATSGVGMCIGAGLYDIGIITTIILIGLQILFHRGFFLKVTQNNQNIQMEIYYEDYALKDIREVFDKYGIDTDAYDVIKGWRANASYFYIAKEFVRDNIDIDILEELLSLGGLGIQYCIKTEKAYANLREIESDLLQVEYNEFNNKYNQRDIEARKKMRNLVDSDANKVTNVFSTLF